MLAHRLEAEVEFGLDLIVDVARDADTARRGETLEARRHVDPVAEDIAVFQHDVADVDPDAILDAPILGLGRLTLGHPGLERDRAFDGIDCACELDQGAIAGELDHPSVMLGDQGLRQFDSMRLDPRKRAGFVGADQPAVADHIYGHDGREFAIHARSGHGSPRENFLRTFPQPASSIPARTKSTATPQLRSLTPASAKVHLSPARDSTPRRGSGINGVV